MKKQIKYTIAAFALSLLPLTKTYADSGLLQRIQDKGTIYVGTEGTYAPFTYHDKSGKLTGYDVEVTRAVADKLGIKVEFKETQWDAMLAGLNNNRFDVVANQVALTTPERRAKYGITTPYSYSGAVVAARSDSDIGAWSDIKGLSSAQSLTSNHTETARKYGAELVTVDGLAQGLQLVRQKRADLTINDGLAVLDYLKSVPNSGLKIVLRDENKLGSGLIVLKHNIDAIPEFNRALQELQQDGTLRKLGIQFFGEDISVK